MSQTRYASLVPLKSLNRSRMAKLMAKAQPLEVRSRTTLSAQEERNWFVYLLDGSAKLKAPRSKTEKFTADSDRALCPIFTERTMTETAIVAGRSKLIKVDKHQFQMLRDEQKEADNEAIEVNEVRVVEVEANIMRRLFDDYRDRKIPVPSIPEVAMRIREISSDPDASIADLNRLLETDPAIAGKLVAAANSALIGGSVRTTTLRDALVRLGMKQSCQLATSLAMRELFKFSNPELRETIRNLWRHSVHVGAAARILAPRARPPLDADQAFLVGLLHGIGAVPLLSYFDDYRPITGSIAVTSSLRKLGNLVSSMVLERWGMSPAFVEAAEMAGRWELAGEESSYADLVNIAKHHVWRIEDPNRPLPELKAVAAFHGFEHEPLDAEGRLAVLVDSPAIEALLDLLG